MVDVGEMLLWLVVCIDFYVLVEVDVVDDVDVGERQVGVWGVFVVLFVQCVVLGVVCVLVGGVFVQWVGVWKVMFGWYVLRLWGVLDIDGGCLLL